jgi:hypothetical protein
MALKPAKTLSEIADNCTPDPLENDRLKAFFVETAGARSENRDLRQQLLGVFNKDDRPRRILVYGHGGCGKSTELNCFKQSVGSQWFIVDFSIKKYLPPIGIKAEDVLLAMSVALLDKLEEQSNRPSQPQMEIKINDDYLKRIEAFFDELKIITTSTRDAKAGGSASLGFGLGALWGKIFDAKAQLSAELSYGSKKEESAVHKIRQRPWDLVVAVNNLLLAVEGVLKDAGRKLLFVVEDLDKIQQADAEDIFIRNNLLLSKLNANIIYTIPIFTFYTDNAAAIRAQFDGDFALPMIKVFQRDGSLADGYAKIKELILKRVDPSMIDADALHLLICSTGGVLRHIFETLQAISSFASIRNNRINRKNIRDALNEKRGDLGVMIGWPRDKDGKQDKPEPLYDTLLEAAKKQSAGEEYPPRNDPATHVLLRSCALIEYNGERWLGVHPLAWEYLRALDRDPGLSPYEKAAALPPP